MEEKTIIAVVGLILIAILQVIAWVMGYDGQITQLVGTIFGLIIGFYFKGKVNAEENPPSK